MKRIFAFLLAFVILAGTLPAVLRVEADATVLPKGMRLPPEVARAYADLIQAEYDAGKYNVRIYMFDGGGDVPMMWLASGNGGDESYIAYDYNDHVYTWQNGVVQQCKWISSVLKEGENGVVAQESISMASDHDYVFKFYRLSGGRMADEPFATGRFGLNGVVFNDEYLGDVEDISWDEFYDLVDKDAELLADATSGLSDQLNLYGEWIEGWDVLSELNKIILADDISKMDPAMRNAYRSIVQKEVDRMGVYLQTDPYGGYDSVKPGVAGVHLVDATNDGKEELFLYTTADEEVSEYPMSVEIYSFDSGSCKQIYAEGVGTNFDLRQADDGRRYLLVGYTKHGYYPYLWNGSEFASPELSEAQWAEVEEAAMGGGMQGEGAKRFDLAMENLGLVDSSNSSLVYASCYFGPDVSGDLLATLAALGVTVRIDPTDMLSGVPYIGDYSKCRLTAEMAQAYADAIESLYGTDYNPRYALLVDVAGNGLPVLITSSGFEIYGLTIWHIVDGKVERFQWDDTIPVGKIALSDYKNNPALILGTITDGLGADSATLVYTSQQGELVLSRSFYQDAVYYSDVDDSDFSYSYYMDGRPVERDVYFNENGKLGHEKILFSYYGGVFGGPQKQEFTAYADSVISALRAYVKACDSGYSFPEAEYVDEAELVEMIAKAAAEAVGGEIEGIYKLDEGIYYVIIVVDGSRKGALVQGSRENGKLSWHVTETHNSPLSNNELTAKLHALQSMSNIALDYTALQNGKKKDAIAQLEHALGNMPGTVPNDLAKAEIADYIGLAISSECTVTLKGKNNRFQPDAESVEAIREQAEKAKAEYEKLLAEYGVTLNKPITVIIRIVWKNMDGNEPCQITLDGALLEALGGCDAQILLGDIRHYIHIGAENLRTIIDVCGSVDVQLVRENEGKYSINFLDAQGAIIEKLDTPIGFALPAENELTTIMVSYAGGSMNWGGQFDAAAKCISFDASYSGHYELLTNAVEIADVSGLDEETRAAIAFLVSKGYMSAEDGLFNPDSELNRYQFSQALVGMFFALDPSLTTGFADVPTDSPFYSYVASGESLDIIKGYDEVTFGGEDSITVEQMLALAARTLINYKGYAEPDAPYDYLSSFTDGHAVSDWAQSQVALAIREGLIDRGGDLCPADAVTRGEAARILYRLFLLLHEVPAVALELPGTSGVSDKPGETPNTNSDGAESGGLGIGGIVAIAVVAVAAVGAGGFVFLRKRKPKA